MSTVQQKGNSSWRFGRVHKNHCMLLGRNLGALSTFLALLGHNLRMDSKGISRTILLGFKRKPGHTSCKSQQLVGEGEEKRGHTDCIRLVWGSATRWASSERWRKSEAQGVGDRVLRKEKERKSDTFMGNSEKGEGLRIVICCFVINCARGGDPGKEEPTMSSKG